MTAPGEARKPRKLAPYHPPVFAAEGSWRLVGRLALAFVIVCGMSLRQVASCAVPDPHARVRVLLLPMSSQLERALRTALVPWSMVVERVETQEAVLVSARGASVLARERGAGAVVWVAGDGPRTLLWVYDARVDTAQFRVVQRSTTAKGVRRPPSPSLAAALALSVKTLLRAAQPAQLPVDAESIDAAEWERVDWVSPPAAAEHVAPTGEPPDAPRTDARPFSVAAPIVPVLPSPWQVTVGADLRARAHADGNEGRFRLGLRHAPWAPIGGDRTALWFALGIDLGLPRAIEAPAFRGDYQEVAAGAGLGLTQALGGRWRVGLQIGAQAHWTALSGTLLSDDTHVERSRSSPGLTLRPEVELVLGQLTFMVQPGVGYFLRRQRYDVDGVEVLATRSPWYSIGVGVGLLL